MKTLNILCNLIFFCLFLINWRRRNLYGSKNRDLLAGFLFLAQGMTCVLNCININKHNWKKKPASNNKPNKGCEMLKRYYFRNKMWASSSCTCLISFYNRFRVAWHVATWHQKKIKINQLFLFSRGQYIHDAWLFQKYKPCPLEAVCKRWSSLLDYWGGIKYFQRSTIWAYLSICKKTSYRAAGYTWVSYIL